MKEVTNTQIIENRAKWAKRIAPFTMLFLIGGLITNFMSIRQPEYFRITMILLAVGFVFAIVSSYLTNRWVREPRSDQVLVSMLKKFSNEYVLFNYTTRAGHILLTPSCLYAITVKQHKGKITINGRRMNRQFNWKQFIRLFADEGLGSPVAEAESNVSSLSKLLNKELSEEEIPEIRPLILFSNKESDLVIKQSPPVPVVQSHEFKNYLREHTKNKVISASQRSQLAKIIGGQWAELHKI
jgi:hypothetical protein